MTYIGIVYDLTWLKIGLFSLENGFQLLFFDLNRFIKRKQEKELEDL